MDEIEWESSLDFTWQDEMSELTPPLSSPLSPSLPSPLPVRESIGDKLLRHLEQANVISRSSDLGYIINDIFFRRKIDGTIAVQKGTRQLDWKKIQHALCFIDPEANTPERKVQYQELLRPVRRREKKKNSYEQKRTRLDALELKLNNLDEKVQKQFSLLPFPSSSSSSSSYASPARFTQPPTTPAPPSFLSIIIQQLTFQIDIILENQQIMASMLMKIMINNENVGDSQ